MKNDMQVVSQTAVGLARKLVVFAPLFIDVHRKAQASGKAVWYLGRDADAFYEAMRGIFPCRYFEGLNRDFVYAHRNIVRSWVYGCGFKDGDYMIDTGFAGSIYRSLIRSDIKIYGVLITGSKKPDYPFTSFHRSLVHELCGSDENRIHQYRGDITSMEYAPRDRMIDTPYRGFPRVTCRPAQHKAAAHFKHTFARVFRVAVLKELRSEAEHGKPQTAVGRAPAQDGA